MHEIRLKRVYETAAESDGFRILIDRLWPRGIKKTDLSFSIWAKSITPSPEARTDFAHKPERMAEFRERYLHELNQNPESPAFLETVQNELKEQNVTLLYAAKDPAINHAVILQEWLENKRMQKS